MFLAMVKTYTRTKKTCIFTGSLLRAVTDAVDADNAGCHSTTTRATYRQKQKKAVAEAAVKSFFGHLWYLSEILASLAFFDSAVSAEVKSAMLKAPDMKTTDHPRCIAFNSTVPVPQKQLSDCIITQSSFSQH